MKTNERKLRICGRSFSRQAMPTRVPEIRLMGKWLHQAGFKVGDEITVCIKRGELQIHVSRKWPFEKDKTAARASKKPPLRQASIGDRTARKPSHYRTGFRLPERL